LSEFGGDIAKWRTYANSLRLRLAIRVSNVDPALAKTEGEKSLSSDAGLLESENMEHNNVLGKNPFSLMVNLFGFVLDQVERSNIIEGKLAASNKNVLLNLYYTPSQLTENSLIFDKKLMKTWWDQGFKYANDKAINVKENELKDR